MGYITKAEYDVFFPSNDLSTEEFDMYVEAASVIIDRLSINRIPSFGGLSEFSAYTQDKVQRATAAQINTIESQGGEAALNGDPSAIVGSVSIGRYSESNGGKSGSGSGIQLIDSIPVSPMVKMYLQPTGLIYPGLGRRETLNTFR